jgi:hypothetical protein
MRKKEKQLGESIKDKLLIGCIVILLLAVVYLFGKSNSLFLGATGSQTPTPTIEVILDTPTPTPQNTYNNQNNYVPQKVIQASTPTPQPPQIIPVVMPHNGLVYNCRQEGASVVKEASQALANATKDYLNCDSKALADKTSCSNKCQAQYQQYDCSSESVRTLGGYSTFNDCLNGNSKTFQDCNNICYSYGSHCLDSLSPYTSTWNNLINTYCK